MNNELGDLYNIVITWVAERQREGKLSDDWGSVMSFGGDQIVSLHRNGMRLGPYLVIYNTHYEAHNVIHPRLGMVEVLGYCDAADPNFFEKLLNDMVGIQCEDALSRMREMHDDDQS